MLWRFFKGLQQRRLGGFAQHMDFVKDVDPMTPRRSE
jgi:hypothetical protein